jgi:serine protease
MNVVTRARAHAAAFIGVALWLATVAAQDALPTAARRVVSGLAAPGIDQGLHVRSRPRATRRALDFSIEQQGSGNSRYLRGSLIVKFRPGTSPQAQAAMLALVAGRATPDLPYASFDIVDIDRQADPEAIAFRLSGQPDVEYAQARYRAQPLLTPNDPFYSLQWSYPALEMERAWDINPGASPAITVAVLDSGLAYTNTVLRFVQPNPQSIDGILYPALGSVNIQAAAAFDLVAADRVVSPYDFIWDDNTPIDMDGHGTHIAGTIGQLTNNGVGAAGMAFNVKLMPVKVIDGFWDAYFESPYIGTDDTIARGIRYAVDSGAKVLNLSIGRTGPPAPAIRDAVTYAVSRGAFVAAAGGNDFLDGNPVERFAELAPQIDGMVAVAAVGRDRNRAVYSSTGSYIELAAPGGDSVRGGGGAAILQQTYNYDFTDTFVNGAVGFRAPRFDVFAYVYYEGTSMATAHVSGLAALLMQQGITSPAAVEAAMKAFATDLGTPGRDDQYGYGLINGRKTLRGMGLAR